MSIARRSGIPRRRSWPANAPRRATSSQGGATAYFQYAGSLVVDHDVPDSGRRVLVRWSSEPAARDTPGRVMVAIVGPGVAGVRAAGYGTFRAHHVGGLPAGYKAVVFYYAKWPAAATERARTRQGLEQLARRIEQVAAARAANPAERRREAPGTRRDQQLDRPGRRTHGPIPRCRYARDATRAAGPLH